MTCTTEVQGGKDFLLELGYGFTGAVTFQNTGDTVTQVDHGLVNGDLVKFSAVVTTTTITTNTNYYVINKTDDTFQVSLTRGGSAVAIDADGTGTAVEAFERIAGLRSTTFTLNAEEIDITNQDSSQWKEILCGAGIKSLTISGSGIFKDEYSFKKVRNLCLAQDISNWRVLVTLAGDYYLAAFKITSLEQAGDYNNESSYSISLSGSGAVTFTEV